MLQPICVILILYNDTVTPSWKVQKCIVIKTMLHKFHVLQPQDLCAEVHGFDSIQAY